MAYTGGQLIADVLTGTGLRTVFAIGGAAHTYLLKPLDEAGVTIVSNRHEAGAVGAADGYARVSGNPGVALIVADQGLPNAIGALAVAWHAASPVVVLVASPPRSHAEADRAIDQDQLALVAPICKWARTLPSAERLEDYLQTAMKHARSGRPGPVVLLVPENALQAEVARRETTVWPTAQGPRPDPAAICDAAGIILAARRPMIVAGGGAAWSGASEELREIGTRWSIPVLGNSLGRGQVAEDNRLSFSWPYAQPAARHADVVIVVGARLTQRLGLGLPPRFSPDAKFIQIDIDPGAFNRNRPVDVTIMADARHALAALIAALESAGLGRFDTGWVTSALAPRRRRLDELIESESPSIHPLQLGHAIMQRLPRDAQIIGDGADIQTWMYGALRVRRTRGFLDHYPMGAMGSATPLAVGAAAAHRERNGKNAPLTVLITGDGAIGFHPAELHAAVRSGLDLLVVVGNDGAWGTEMHGQREAIGRSINTELDLLPYEKLGEAFGATGLRIATQGELESGLDRAFEADGVRVVNVEIDRDAGLELKQNPDVRMILFSDVLDGQAGLL